MNYLWYYIRLLDLPPEHSGNEEFTPGGNPGISPFTFANRNNNAPKGTDEPIAAATTTTGGGIALVTPEANPFEDSDDPLYDSEHRTWKAMNNRCANPNANNWSYYGGRGITVCDRWLHSFQNFLADMGPRPEPKRLYSIDRIDNDGNYEPGNCRWATRKEQRANQRLSVAIA